MVHGFSSLGQMLQTCLCLFMPQEGGSPGENTPEAQNPEKVSVF